MAQTTILASAQTAATSSDITLLQGETRTVGIFSSAAIADYIAFPIMIDTPGDDRQIGTLTNLVPAVVISGPGTFRVKRPDISADGVDAGVYTEG